MKKVDLNNTIVEAKREGDGKIILDFFKANEFPTFAGQLSPTGFRYSNDSWTSRGCYYGIINGDLNFFKEGELQNYENVKILEMVDGHIKLPVEEKTFPREMLVWDNHEEDATYCTIVGYIEGVEFPWVSISSVSCGDRYHGYKNAKEIDIVETISKEEAEKRLDVKIKD